MIQKLLDRMEQMTQRAIEEGKKFLTTEEVQEHRLSICRSCEFFFSPTGQCKKCGCFTIAKTKITMQRCPIGKWEKVIIDDKK